jgi:hypothetical protein
MTFFCLFVRLHAANYVIARTYKQTKEKWETCGTSCRILPCSANQDEQHKHALLLCIFFSLHEFEKEERKKTHTRTQK